MKTHPMSVLAFALALTVAPSLRAAINVVQPGGANHISFSICPAVDGANQLNPDPATYLPPPGANDPVMNELNNGDTPFVGWTFNVGAALNGTLTINYYKSVFDDEHYSGADIKATYVKGAGDPANLRFVQLVDTTMPKTGANNPYIDPFPSDDKPPPPLPFYWTEKENKKYGLTFYDASRRYHPPTSSVTWRGSLFLSSWDGKVPGTVNVHDGVKWGFDAGCVAVEIISLTLTSTLQNDNLILTWPETVSNAYVQYTPTLDTPTWIPLTNAPVLSNNQMRVEFTPSVQPYFFRLAYENTNPPTAMQPAYLAVSPQSDTVEQGHEAYLSVKGDGDGTLNYQWYFNGLAISGATDRELIFTHAQFTNQGAYQAAITNTAGGQTSAPVVLSVVADTNKPTIVSAVASSNLFSITVTFSEGLNPTPSLNPANFQVQRISPPGTVSIINAVQGADDTMVELTPSAPLSPSSGYMIQVFNVGDWATPQNIIVPGSSTTFTTGP